MELVTVIKQVELNVTTRSGETFDHGRIDCVVLTTLKDYRRWTGIDREGIIACRVGVEPIFQPTGLAKSVMKDFNVASLPPPVDTLSAEITHSAARNKVQRRRQKNQAADRRPARHGGRLARSRVPSHKPTETGAYQDDRPCG